MLTTAAAIIIQREMKMSVDTSTLLAREERRRYAVTAWTKG